MQQRAEYAADDPHIAIDPQRSGELSAVFFLQAGRFRSMFGGFGGRSRTFNDSFRCHSVSLLAAEQQRDPALLEYSDKIILPPSCLEKLAHLEITYPMIFELCNPHDLQRRLHCGVLEFIAQEGMVYLPYWMMENMHLNEGAPSVLFFHAPSRVASPTCVCVCDLRLAFATASRLRFRLRLRRAHVG